MVNLYKLKEVAVLAFVAGLLTGMVVGFAACTPDPDTATWSITTGGRE